MPSTRRVASRSSTTSCVRCAGPGQLHEVEGRAGVASTGSSRISLLPTPGHTIGHQSVLIEGGQRDVVITGDVLVHGVQLVNPDIAYAFERDRSQARRTRTTLLADAEERQALLATAHLTRPFVRLGRPSRGLCRG